MDKTRWFSVGTPPHRRGWYEFYDSLWGIETMLEFTGEYWKWEHLPGAMNTYPKDKWRGITYHEYMRTKNG